MAIVAVAGDHQEGHPERFEGPPVVHRAISALERHPVAASENVERDLQIRPVEGARQVAGRGPRRRGSVCRPP